MSEEKGVKQRLYTVNKCGVISDESPWTWRRRAYAGLVESVKIGRGLRIPAEEVERIIAESTRPRVIKTR
jgi:hypothetical protein